MKIYFVTKNKYKLDEAVLAMQKFGIEVEQIPEEKIEPKEMNIKEVAEFNAKHFFEKYKKPIAVEDTGIFFKAYKDFPGNHPKLMFNTLGYKGLLKLLEGENREVEFKSVIGYHDGNLKLFEGTLSCIADTKAGDLDKDVMPYERFLLVDGKLISQYPREEKNKLSHRAKAFRKLGEFLTKQ